MAHIIQIKRGTAAALDAANPLLADGQQAYEKDTGRLKIGNGVDSYNDLPYFMGEAPAGTLVNRGYFTPAGDYPSTGGSGPLGVPKANDFWITNAEGTIDGLNRAERSMVIALEDDPEQDGTKWKIIE
jgi:hypothetical protein